jgi:plasmid maintenance system antidote protein VapI
MALTRAMLKGMGLTEEQVSAIIEEHTNVTSSLKDQIKAYKADAEKLQTVQTELDGLKENIKKDNWQKKYEDEHKAYENYKTEVSTKETLSKIKGAYKKLLKATKIGDDHIAAIMRVTDFSNMKLKDNSNELVDADKLTESIKNEWKGFIPKGGTNPPGVDNPPKNDNDPHDNSNYAKQLEAKYNQNLYGKAKED